MDQEHLAAIHLARHDFYFFVRWMFLKRKKFKWMRGKQHKIICDALMRVYRGECKRLIINIPPRYSKTEIAVVMFIAWSMGKNPDSEFIHACYSGALATKNSGEIREILKTPEYQEIFPDAKLRNDSQAKHEWRTTEGGCMYAVGTGGTITGYGAGKVREGFGGAIIGDDLHKADESRSSVMRNNVIEWFQNTLESRTNSPHTPIIIIMQRLHEMDIAGWLLAGNNGEEWEHIKLEALQPDGSALWPEKHTRERLLQMQEAAPYTFSGQYQQNPSPSDGGIFKPARITVVPDLPIDAGIKWVRGWDLASTTDGDWTVGAKLGRLSDGRFIIADIARDRIGPDERDLMMKNVAMADGRGVKQSIPQDPGQAGKSQVLYFSKMLAGLNLTFSPESGDKITRAEPFASQVNSGNVIMVASPMCDALRAEMAMFPNGAHDDQVDALSRAFNELLELKNKLKISPELLAMAKTRRR